ncbi:MAG TPA: mechanosensitive ion channel family protein [Gemmatimonadaceae bacterium]|nr:mechanosensitive ion channel family protein [Gemmatimonadaceae bacterium]
MPRRDSPVAGQPGEPHGPRRVGSRRTRRTGRRFTAGRRRTAQQSARTRLRSFRQASILAVAITGLLLLLFAPEEAGIAQDPTPGAAAPAAQAEAAQDPVAEGPAEVAAVRPDTIVRAAGEEARRTARNLWYGFLGALPTFLVAMVVLLIAWALVRIVRPLLRLAFGQWERGDAATAVIGIAIWLLAVGIAVSVVAGDVRALLGSLGLVGLALSWALQTPIESFTGWLLNSFQGYYRVGDRVAVGEVFGDVYRIDFLTTTVWEAGGRQRLGFVNAEQPTGRLITFPNSEVLSGSIVNLTRDFPYVWDELAVQVGSRTDVEYAMRVLLEVTSGVVGEHMREPAERYERILLAAQLDGDVSREPQVFVSLDESAMTLTVRYLVGARERRAWKSRLAQAVAAELDRPERRARIVAAYPRQQIQLLDAGELPADPPGGGTRPD